MFKQSYSKEELNKLLANTIPRKGWDFSKMNTQRQPVPWKYLDIIPLYLKNKDHTLDIGTGGGENFLKLSKLFKLGVGIDIDPEMVQVARYNGKEVSNTSFYQDSEHLENTKKQFDMVINRHAPFDFTSTFNHLKPGGYFITQQVGEKNMLNIKKVMNKVTNTPTIIANEIKKTGFKLLAFMEYNVEYVVLDVESLVFWLHALDMLHADFQGSETLKNVKLFNQILEGNINESGFVTNEHRYLAIAQK